MSNRIPFQLPFQTLRGLNVKNGALAPITPSSAFRVFSSTPALGKKSKGGRKKKASKVFRDAYTVRQIEARRTANLARQAVLKKERIETMGDAIRGRPTPFVESFDTTLELSGTDPSGVAASDAGARPPTESNSGTPEPTNTPSTTTQDNLNHFLSHRELENNLRYSHALSSPYVDTGADPNKIANVVAQHEADHQNAEEAVRRIVSLNLGSSKDKMRVNVQRCIKTFGRQNTDGKVPPKGLSAAQLNDSQPKPQEVVRAGPDTGSSEVQIAILTAKIRVLANAHEGDGRMDKVNKRNLRLLLHRRQKLLAYLNRKERGSGRWQHLIDTLGLTEATWKGEIEVR